MDEKTATFWLSIWGAALATVLAIMKGFEFYKSQRLSFKSTAQLTSSDEIGNTIIILNNSGIAATIHYFDLVWTDRLSLFGWRVPFTRKVVDDSSPLDGDSYSVTLPPHSTLPLLFSEGDHFKWGAGLKHNIYLRIWVIGRRAPVWLWVTGP
jgi:hypothetical protein